jgi:hypothetical protein
VDGPVDVAAIHGVHVDDGLGPEFARCLGESAGVSHITVDVGDPRRQFSLMLAAVEGGNFVAAGG